MREAFHTTVTERASFRSCRRQWYLDNVLRLRPKAQVTWYLLYGDVMHSALDAYYRPTSSRSTRPPRKISTALDAFEAAWSEENQKLKDEYGPLYSMGIEEEWFHYQEIGRQTLTYYDRFDKQDPLFDKVIAVGVEERSYVDILYPSTREHQMDFPLLSGRIDVVAQRSGDTFIVDHKNLGSKASDRALDVDDQLTGYCYLWWRISGKAPRGAYYNVLIKDPPKAPKLISNDSKLSQDKAQRTTHDLYLDAIRDNDFDKADYTDFLAFLSEKGWTQFFQRLGPVTRNEAELFSFEQRLYWEYMDMSFALEHEELRYPNPSQFTCPSCSMMAICQAMEEKSDIDWIIENSYETASPRHQIPEEILSYKWKGV